MSQQRARLANRAKEHGPWSGFDHDVHSAAMVRRTKWTNASVLAFAGGQDPIEAVVARARALVVKAIDDGWAGPPFDPLALAADFLRLDVLASADVPDARTVSAGRERLRIEFNPNRARGRMRYSLAHEIAHTLFADCGERIRNRGLHEDQFPDDWQLEALCNIAAAEFLMPVGSFPILKSDDLGIESLMRLRKAFDVSTEALLIRAVQMTDESCAMFCASRVDTARASGQYRIDYSVGSSTWETAPLTGDVLPHSSVLSHCERIGYTAIADEEWGATRRLHVECAGIPAYPGSAYPRVVGVAMRAQVPQDKRPRLNILRGSATVPRIAGAKIIVHVVNDATSNWGGGGFAVALRNDHPEAQADFRRWAMNSRNALRLGNVHISEVVDDLRVASIVAQKGYGPSTRPRIRYGALQQGLMKVAELATKESATVHMPRIGCGQAGGSWDVVHEILVATLLAKGLEVFVYDLPNADEPKKEVQTLLQFRERT